MNMMVSWDVTLRCETLHYVVRSYTTLQDANSDPDNTDGLELRIAKICEAIFLSITKSILSSLSQVHYEHNSSDINKLLGYVVFSICLW